MAAPRLLKTSLCLLLLLLAAGRLPAACGESQPAPERRFRFLALADPHFRDRTKYPQGLDGFKAFLEQSKALGADFAVILGDVCGEDPPALAQARKIADQSGVKVHFVRGNHDNAEQFKAAFGDACYSFDHQGWHFANFDSISGQAAWLKADLERVPAGTPIVFWQHYSPSHNPGVRALLDKHNAALALSGDQHGHRHGMNGKLRDVNLPVFRPPVDGGFAVVDVLADGRIALAWRPLGSAKSLTIVHPAEGAEVAGGAGTVVVNAFDSCREVAKVEFDDGSGWKPMAKPTDWTWTAPAELRGGKVQVRATDSAGEVWTAASTYRAGAAAPVVKPGADWPVWGGTPDNRRSTSDKVAPPLRVAWCAAVGGRVNPPVVAGGKVYVTTASQDFEENSAVICLDAATGKELWRARVNCSINCAPAVTSGVVGVFDQFGRACGFDARTGAPPLWRAEGISGAYFGPVGPETGMISAAAGVFYAGDSHPLDAKTGQRPWKSPGGRAMSASAASGGRVVDAGYNLVNCLNAKDGAVLWSNKGGAYHANMIVGDLAILCGKTVVNLADGQAVRALPFSGDGVEGAASPDGRFVVGNSGPWLVAAALADGKPLWRTDLDKVGFAGPLTVAGEHVWVCGRDGSLRAYALKDGKEAWSLKLGPPPAAPAASGNALFVSAGGCVYALVGN